MICNNKYSKSWHVQSGGTIRARRMPVLGHVMTAECRLAALLDAAATGGVERVRLMLDDAQSPGARAAQWTPRRMMPHLREHWPSWCGQAGACAIHCAAGAGHADVVALLLAHGSPADEETRHGVTPLMLAAAGGHPRVVETLLAAGAVVGRAMRDALDGSTGPTALHLACCAADTTASATCAVLLLRAGACLHTVDDLTKRTPLHHAVANGHVATTHVIMSHHAWLQVRDASGETPLAIARAHALHGSKNGKAVLEELCWLPSVRLLWLGHHQVARSGCVATGSTAVAGDVSPAAAASAVEVDEDGLGGDADPHASDTAVINGGSGLQRLTSDLIRLIAAHVVASHAPDNAGGADAEPTTRA